MSLYSPPADLDAQIWTSLPDEYRHTGVTPDWAAANKPGQTADSFLEGPSFDREGRLYVTDIPYGRIFRISQDGKWSLIAEYDGWPNGLKIHKDGRIFITDYKHGIMLLDPDRGTVEPVITHRRSESFRGVNDLFFDASGRLYFTDQGQTGLHDPTGRVFRLNFETEQFDQLISNGPSPNGLVMSPDQKSLYVAMTRGNSVWRLPIFPDGTTSKVGLFARLAGGVSGPDGLAVDKDGRLTICDAGNGAAWMFTKWGEPVYRIRSQTGGRTVTNLAYGGPDNQDLFLTESDTGHILRVTLDVPGEPMYSHI